ncbi:hypothetical protein P7F88_11060 [Vibrio hannami]|nr:hypothetical protein [Vibrio hannami]MDG3086621.1 hypothetical protein [Vibrio hannami]
MAVEFLHDLKEELHGEDIIEYLLEKKKRTATKNSYLPNMRGRQHQEKIEELYNDPKWKRLYGRCYKK